MLLRKHPERYRELLLRERHWLKGQRFWQPFLRGVQKHGVALPDWIEDLRLKTMHYETAATGGRSRVERTGRP